MVKKRKLPLIPTLHASVGSQRSVWPDRNQVWLWRGHCGACTVLIDNEAYRSCMLQVGDIADQSIITIEGLSQNGQLASSSEVHLWKMMHSNVDTALRA